MKTRNISLLVISVLVLFVCGCHPMPEATTENYETSIESVANSEASPHISNAYWTGEFFQANCEKNATCQVAGVSYSGEYEWSIVDKLHSFTTNIYRCDNGVEFGFRSDTGAVVLLNVMNKEFFDTEPYLDDTDNPKDFAESFAKEIARAFIPDIDSYLLFEKEPTVSVKERDGKEYAISYYKITFYKPVCGYASSDYISVKVTSKGHLASIKIGDTGAFDHHTYEIDSEKLQQKVEEKLQSVYEQTNYELLSFEITDQKMTKTPDGKACLYSGITCVLSDQSKQVFRTAVGVVSLINATP